MKNKKKILLLSGLLALSAFLFLFAFNRFSPDEPEYQDVPLRAETKDLSISDIINSAANKKKQVNEDVAPGFINNNSSSVSSMQSDDPEAIARVQALIKANEENVSFGLQEIEKERQGITASADIVEKASSGSKRKTGNKPGGKTDREDESEEVDSVAAEPLSKPVKVSPFHTIALTNSANRNAIKAYVHSEQVVMAGSTLKMRLGEPAYTDNGTAIPKNSPVFGVVTSIDGERVNVEITSINVNGNILPFKKNVYSKDALLGIYVPGNPKSEATKEATGGAIDALPTSGISQVDAAAQIATTIASSAVNAGKQVVSKNVKKMKVTIKTNYEIYLRPDEKSR